MLRINVQVDAECVTFRIEGRLTGSWVQELQDCWQSTLAATKQQRARFDLTEVTYIDEAGKEFLAARYRDGHELVAAGCMMKYVIAEITGSPMLVRRSPDALK